MLTVRRVVAGVAVAGVLVALMRRWWNMAWFKPIVGTL